ncbi:MAG: hypothetical protein AB1489_19350 [Acidobacteriota bacterium]
MEGVIVVVVALILIWVGIKVVKFVFKLVLWMIALGLLLAMFFYYFGNPLTLWQEKSPRAAPAATQRR